MGMNQTEVILRFICRIVIAAGDFNCSKEAMDSAKILNDPVMLMIIFFTTYFILPLSSKDRLRNSPSRDWMQQFVTADPSHVCNDTNSTELLDSFRYLHPTQEKAYTCWSTLLDSRKINYGTRIDYILLSKSLVSCLRKSEVWQEVQGSDHCPVFAELTMELVASQSQPSLSSSNFSAGKQRKLSDFLRTGQKSSPGTESGGSGLAASAKLSLGKRSGSTVDSTSTVKARRLASGKKKVDSKHSKQSLVSFFKPASEDSKQLLHSKDQPVANLLEDKNITVEEDSITSSEETSRTASQEESVSTDSSSSQSDSSANGGKKLSQAWMGVFGGPPKPPLCKGHNEPCVLRTVKKQGPNKNKQFWVCARPGGGKGDPEAKCDFFQWRSTKQK